MSQQQKIAAALARAGIAGVTAWRDTAHPGQSTVGVEALSDPRSAPMRAVTPQRDPKEANSSILIGKLILLAGSVLILSSLFVFLNVR